MGHARTLVSIPSSEDQIQLWKKTLRDGLSVRKVEALAKHLSSDKKAPKQQIIEKETSLFIREAEDKLRSALATQVKIASKARGGKIEIDYYSNDDLGFSFRFSYGVIAANDRHALGKYAISI